MTDAPGLIEKLVMFCCEKQLSSKMARSSAKIHSYDFYAACMPDQCAQGFGNHDGWLCHGFVHICRRAYGLCPTRPFTLCREDANIRKSCKMLLLLLERRTNLEPPLVPGLGVQHRPWNGASLQ